jgi:hypothetical protein
MKIALFIIDMQKAYYNDRTKDSMNDACEYINAIIPLFRKQQLRNKKQPLLLKLGSLLVMQKITTCGEISG